MLTGAAKYADRRLHSLTGAGQANHLFGKCLRHNSLLLRSLRLKG